MERSIRPGDGNRPKGLNLLADDDVMMNRQEFGSLFLKSFLA
jgi:hypothetical protein